MLGWASNTSWLSNRGLVIPRPFQLPSTRWVLECSSMIWSVDQVTKKVNSVYSVHDDYHNDDDDDDDDDAEQQNDVEIRNVSE